MLHSYPYKISVRQEKLPTVLPARDTFVLYFLAHIEVDNEWLWKILWTDETHFHLTGCVNIQNCWIRATENPLETQSEPLHPAKVTVWCGFTASFIIRPYIFQETGALSPVTVNVHWSALWVSFVQPSNSDFSTAWTCGSDHFCARWRFSEHRKSSEASAESAFRKS